MRLVPLILLAVIFIQGKSRATARAVVDERTFELHVTLTGSPILDHIPGTSESRSDVNILNSVEYPSCLSESQSEPDYVTNLKKYFNDGYYTGTYYRKLSSKGELETQAMDVFREYLKDKKYQDIERFFNEWKMTFHSDGPFNTEQDLQLVAEKMTKPDDFMTEVYIADLLTNRDDAHEATKAYKEAFVLQDAARVALFYLGDDDIMHGVLAAGVRRNMDAVFLVFLID